VAAAGVLLGTGVVPEALAVAVVDDVSLHTQKQNHGWRCIVCMHMYAVCKQKMGEV
jgi:hypothetical protein